MNRKSTLGRCGRTIVLVLLTPITTLNASQAMTFCVGHDGRLAIELLVQDRCTCELHPTDGGTASGVISSARLGAEPGLPCLDIPIPGGSPDHRTRTGSAPANERRRGGMLSGVAGLAGPALLYVPPTIPRPKGPDDALQRLLAFVSRGTGLDTVLLQV